MIVCFKYVDFERLVGYLIFNDYNVVWIKGFGVLERDLSGKSVWGGYYRIVGY